MPVFQIFEKEARRKEAIIMEVVFIRQIKLKDQQEDDAHRNTQGESEDVENRKKLVFKKYPDKEAVTPLGSCLYWPQTLYRIVFYF